LIKDQGDIAVIIEYDPHTRERNFISSYLPLDKPNNSDEIIFAYLSACDSPNTNAEFLNSMNASQTIDSNLLHRVSSSSTIRQTTNRQQRNTTTTTQIDRRSSANAVETISTFASNKKYKPVALNVHSSPIYLTNLG